MRVFLDTNVLVSAVATRGICADVFREVLLAHDLVISQPLIVEINRILRVKLKLPDQTISEFIELLRENSESPEASTEAIECEVNIHDQDDIVILNSALAGNTEIFVTGDKELLGLDHLRHMKIISPRQFWEILKG